MDLYVSTLHYSDEESEVLCHILTFMENFMNCSLTSNISLHTEVISFHGLDEQNLKVYSSCHLTEDGNGDITEFCLGLSSTKEEAINILMEFAGQCGHDHDALFYVREIHPQVSPSMWKKRYPYGLAKDKDGIVTTQFKVKDLSWLHVSPAA